MKYVIAIEPGDSNNPDFGVIIPDLPGCYAQGRNLDEAIKDAKESAEGWLEEMLDRGEPAPKASSFSDLVVAHPEWKEWLWAAIDIDLSQMGDVKERVNIILPQRILRRLDALSKEAGDSRSGFIAKMVMSY